MRNAAKTRQEIIEKSAPIFNVHGYAGTKMQMLVEATGYQMGGIYRHFDTKMVLGKAVFQYNYEVIIKNNLQFGDDLTPKEKLLGIIAGYKKMFMTPLVAGGCPILNTATEVDDTDTEMRQLVSSFIAEMQTIIENILEDGVRDGSFQSSVNPKIDALFMIATFQGAIMIGNVSKDIKAIFSIFNRSISFLNDNIFL